MVLGFALAAGMFTPPACAQLASPPMPDAGQVRLRSASLLAGTSLAIALYGRAKWWRDGFDNRLDTEREGWFGQRTYSGGADKLGHFYMTYAGTRLLARSLESLGNSEPQALRMAAWYTLGAFTAIEVLDGYSKKWQLSREDLVMNAGGVGLGMLLETSPALDRLFDFRILYQRSNDPGASFDPFGDYSGQTYLLVAKANGIEAWRRHRLLRYVEVAAGYGTRGYAGDGAFHGARNVYAGVSLNLSELFHAQGGTQPGRTRKLAEAALEYVQVPGTAALQRVRLSRHQEGNRAHGCVD